MTEAVTRRLASHALSLVGVGRRFGAVVALNNVSLEVGAGERRAIIGANGAGKTTLFNTVTGDFPPTTGRVLFFGEDITRLPPHTRSRLGIGRTFQTCRLFPFLSVRDNLLLGCHAAMHTGVWSDGLHLPRSSRAQREAMHEVDELLELLSLEEVADRLATELPLGMQRLTEIGRALATRPKLLLLDEATSGVSRSETKELVEVLRRCRRTHGLSLLVVEHDVALVLSLCSWIYVLDFGRVLTSGRPAEVRSDPAVIEAYLGRSDSEAAVPAPEEVRLAARS